MRTSEPVFLCEDCDEKLPHFADELAWYNAQLFCEDCWAERLYNAEEDAGLPAFEDLEPFVPEHEEEIKALHAKLEAAMNPYLWRIREKHITDQKMVIAIIGTREPTQKQKNAIIDILEDLDFKTDRIISGCAYGVDAFALTHAHNGGFETIGILPWASYNLDVQKVCNAVHVIDEFTPEIIEAAKQSVLDHHPAPQRLTQGAMKLHMRNYGIIRWADRVYALPSNKSGGGGTGQGIRLAQALNIPVKLIGITE